MTSIQLSLQTINHVVKMSSSTSLRTDVFAATREGKIVDKIRNVSLVRGYNSDHKELLQVVFNMQRA